MTLPPPLLAHAGGFSWDEALLVLAPLLVIGGLLWLANRRAGKLDESTGAEAEAEVETSEPHPD